MYLLCAMNLGRLVNMTEKYNLPTHITFESLQRARMPDFTFSGLYREPNIIGRLADEYVLVKESLYKGEVMQFHYISPEVLDTLSKIKDDNIRWGLVQNPNTSGKILHSMATNLLDDPYSNSMIREIATHPNVLPETLSYMANSPSYRWQEVVATNPKTPTECLRKLMKEHSAPIPVHYPIYRNAEITLEHKTNGK